MAQVAITALLRQQQSLCIVPQNLYEFWAICTRPIMPANGLGLTIKQAEGELARAKSLFTLIPDSPAIYSEWEQLVARYEAKGRTSHDARLVAAMNVHGIPQILTFNTGDFARYPSIVVLSPEKVTA
jgi:predicted nucleic acid-binding protein